MAQPYARSFNFSAGPGVLPVEVLEQARDGMLNYQGTGKSVMEMSHRSKAYEKIIAEAEADLRTLMAIPSNYKVLFLQGGASFQFSMVPLNFLSSGKVADYVITGSWGIKAREAAAAHGKVNVVFEGKGTNYDHTPRVHQLQFDGNAAYVHVTSNETIQGVDLLSDPEVGPDLVCDMSSNILSRPVDVSRYALIYAGAQKNMGPAGVTVVILREDLLDKINPGLSPMLDYRTHVENGSMYNTPPCWSIYICGLVYKHLLGLGGLTEVARRNEEKAKVIYDAIDGSEGFYRGHAQVASRSRMNVTFTLGNADLTTDFLKGAEAQGLEELKGHRSVGGCRASIYNAMPLEGCQVLAGFMSDFAHKRG